MRKRIANRLRRWADRFDYAGAPKAIGWSFTFEAGRGIVFREDGRGCRLWYLGDDSYERAHGETDTDHARLPLKPGGHWVRAERSRP